MEELQKKISKNQIYKSLITELEPDILESEFKWVLENTANN